MIECRPTEITEEEEALDTHHINSFYRAFGKRAFDILFVIAIAPLGLLLVGLMGFVTAMDGHNPFFWQKRVRWNGKEFWLLKIRTTVPDAEAKHKAYLRHHPANRREWEDRQKLGKVPRITWLGRFLRKSSFDELPQLWNVLIGDMSLVGPRPMMVYQRQLYPGRAYFEMRPGITGNRQVSDRNERCFARQALFDDDYQARMSLKTDMKILVQTPGVVFRGAGR